MNVGDAVTIVDIPRVGPINDPGHARVIAGSSPTYRIWSGSTPELTLVHGDMVYAAENCSRAPPTENTAVILLR